MHRVSAHVGKLLIAAVGLAASVPVLGDTQPTLPVPPPPTPGPLCPYPLALLSDHEVGDVIVQFRITTEGRVRDTFIKQSSGHLPLDDAALACVAKLRYVPAMQNGKPIESYKTYKISYSLRPPNVSKASPTQQTGTPPPHP